MTNWVKTVSGVASPAQDTMLVIGAGRRKRRRLLTSVTKMKNKVACTRYRTTDLFITNEMLCHWAIRAIWRLSGIEPRPNASNAFILPRHHRRWFHIMSSSVLAHFRGLKPGPPAPKAGIILLDQTDKDGHHMFTATIYIYNSSEFYTSIHPSLKIDARIVEQKRQDEWSWRWNWNWKDQQHQTDMVPTACWLQVTRGHQTTNKKQRTKNKEQKTKNNKHKHQPFCSPSLWV